MCVCGICGQLFHPLFLSLLILWIFQTFRSFLLKSSDLSMVNPHISLNPWNPPIHGAILRFSKDFYCEIHGFHWQSSDLAGGFISVKSSGRSEEFIYFVWVSVWHLDRLPFTQSPLIVPLSLQMVFNWKLNFHEHRSEQIGLVADLSVRFILCFLLYSSHHEILHVFVVKSSDFLVNPWVNPQIVWISLNP